MRPAGIGPDVDIDELATWRDRLGRVGVWHGIFGGLPAEAVREAAAEIEALGYRSLWFGEALGKEAFAHAGTLLAATERIVVGSGIANVWAREPYAMRGGAQTLAEAYPGRFVLGLGVSHGPLAELRGQAYARPLSKMRTYLAAMDTAPYDGPAPTHQPPTVLAALRPKMMELARDAADGAHPYFVPVEHTARAREVLGNAPLLIPEQAVVLETDPTRAREIGRAHTVRYLALPNYRNNLLDLGFTEADLTDAGSDRLVDAIVAWGSAEAIGARVTEHLDAGADHVLIQPISGLALDELTELAPALVS